MSKQSAKELRYRLESAHNFIRMRLGEEELKQHLYATDKEWMLERMNEHYKQMSLEEFEARLNNQKW